MTSQEQSYQSKIERAMSTIKERDGYRLVASESESAVQIDRPGTNERIEMVTIHADALSSPSFCVGVYSTVDNPNGEPTQLVELSLAEAL